MLFGDFFVFILFLVFVGLSVLIGDFCMLIGFVYGVFRVLKLVVVFGMVCGCMVILYFFGGGVVYDGCVCKCFVFRVY